MGYDIVRPGAGSGSGSGGGGTAWDFSPPSAADFTVTAGETAPTASDDADVGMIVDFPHPTTGDNYRIIARPIPSPAASWQVTAKMTCLMSSGGYPNYVGCGLSILDSADGQHYTFKADSGLLNAYSGGIGGNYGSCALGQFVGPTHWLRVAYDAGDALYRAWLSLDGKAWNQIMEDDIAGFSHKMDAVGFGCFYNSDVDNNHTAKLTCHYWEQDF